MLTRGKGLVGIQRIKNCAKVPPGDCWRTIILRKESEESERKISFLAD